MSNRIHALAQQLTGKTSLEECSLDEVRQLTERYPYFAPAQFLYLQKLKQEESPEYDKQYKKAVLFYHDPLLFDYFIASENFYKDEESAKDLVQSYIHQPPKVSEPEPVVESDTSLPVVEENPIPIVEEETIEPKEKKEEESENEEEGESSLRVKDIVDDSLRSEETDLVQPVEEKASVKEEPSPAVPETVHERSSSDLLFEPYHTVDYFASQGIKVVQEEAPKDKLGKGLKSFTEWLKTMKRLPAAQTGSVGEASAEKKVEMMATDSVNDSDVVTEAMAEVWIKQGNKEKALDIYKKLSLLNPSKTAYFAAKIENLKIS